LAELAVSKDNPRRSEVKALALLDRGAEFGLDLGDDKFWLYSKPDTYVRNEAKSFQVLLKYALDHPENGVAAEEIAACYENREENRCLPGEHGISKDLVEARRWYERAARADPASAGWDLTRFYTQGLGGLPKDPVKAAEWALVALAHGSYEAVSELIDKRGERVASDVVRAIQTKLRTLGLRNGPSTGIIDDETRPALQRVRNPLELELQDEQILAASR
jgi:TPR repeat protein